MQKVIVTGGAGFIGSNLVDELIKQKIEVIVLDNLSTGKQENINPLAVFYECDVSKMPMNTFAYLFKDVDTVFHLAATPQVQYSVENPTDNNNLHSLINMLEVSRTLGIKRFIFSSSSAVYGNPKYTPIDEKHPTSPLSPYALHKLIGEQYCKLYSDIYDLDTVSLRYFNVYGNRMSNEGAYKSIISVFKEQMLNNKPLTIYNDGEQRRDFIHVDDVVDANILVAKRKETKFKGNIYNVGSGKSYSINEIANIFGGKKQYKNKVLEPFETLAETAKIDLDLDFKPKDILKEWIENYLKNE